MTLDFQWLRLLCVSLGVASLSLPVLAHGASGFPDTDLWWRQETSLRSSKLNVPAISLAQSKDQFETRKKHLLGLWVTKDMSKDQYAGRALADLYTGQWTENAEASLRNTAEGKLVADLGFAA